MSSRDMSRRRFLLTGAAGLAAGGLAGGSRARAAVETPAEREIVIVARETRWEIAPGKVIRAMAYNGQVPGPPIRVREGERVHVRLRNELAEPTTIHWHGVNVPNAMDGVPGVTQEPVAPGSEFVYAFEARPAGTRWYHTHVREHHQMDLGLVAPLIIDPAGPEPFPFDREYTLVLDDWATGTGRPLASTAEGTAGGRGGMGGMMGGGGMMGRMMGRGGMMGGMMGRSSSPAYDTMTINGKAYPATEPLAVAKGERVRLRLINASAEHTHVIRLAGHRLKVTHTDGNPLEYPVEVDAVPIAPSERYDVLVEAKRPGAWRLACTQPGHAEAGEQTIVLYEGHDPATAAPVIEGADNLALWHYGLGGGRDVLPRASGETREFELVLSGGMMGSDAWTINGKRYPRTDPLRVRRGDRVRVSLRNMSMEAHPMHLHGQSFRLLAVNGARIRAPIIKDSQDVEAHMGSAVVEFTAHNPGDWFFHCHKPMHMEGGMIVLAQIAGA